MISFCFSPVGQNLYIHLLVPPLLSQSPLPALPLSLELRGSHWLTALLPVLPRVDLHWTILHLCQTPTPKDLISSCTSLCLAVTHLDPRDCGCRRSLSCLGLWRLVCKGEMTRLSVIHHWLGLKGSWEDEEESVHVHEYIQFDGRRTSKRYLPCGVKDVDTYIYKCQQYNDNKTFLVQGYTDSPEHVHSHHSLMTEPWSSFVITTPVHFGVISRTS